MDIQPQAARFHTEATADGLKVVIPARRNWVTVLFLSAWLGGWAMGETNVAGQLLHGGGKTAAAFLVFWLVAWTLGGIFALGSVLWQLAGREVLTANSTALIHRVEIFGLGVNRSYAASGIKNLRATERPASPTSNQRVLFPPLFGAGHGLIAFDYGARTIRTGSSLDEAEAKLLVSSLAPHLPRQL
ncbi:hypothetical protein FHW83_005351 [Duganella sp. SG902]|uniref:hypothetical protein n=1 Tax=Duganella sp. SG902 TaxID=2587016 RepID=UPI00159D4CA9|nr:hypothetical protein [Duganella sp. SG902]NVM79510.1 hypothetical protein [Duganella sp. SG902]